MNFKFKLSKRLALMKASLAASAALVLLALACDRTDLTGPQQLLHPLTEVVASSAGTWQNGRSTSGSAPRC